MMKILYYIRKYPLSLTVIAIVLYLSFFKPPTEDLPKIPQMDKLVHICMYMGLSGVLWIEFFKAHRLGEKPMKHAWIGACVCPILFSGIIELLQEYATTYRGGDWWDFAANTCGVLLGAWIVLKLKKYIPFLK